MYVSSYGGIDVTFAMNEMLDQGWQVKGFQSDGPVASVKKWAPYAMENLHKYGDISWARYQFFKFILQWTTRLYDAKIVGAMGVGGLLNYLPVVSLDGKLLASINNVLPTDPYHHLLLELRAKAMVSSENFQKAFGGKTKCKLIDIDCQLSVQTNFTWESIDQWNKLLERGVKIVALEGKYDFPFGIQTVTSWMYEMPFAKKAFVKENWESSEFGKTKTWKNLMQEVVDDAGHTVTLDRPEVVYKRMEQMIKGDILQ